MAQRLNTDLNIIQQSDVEIQVDPVTADLNIIQKLDDEPNDVGGLTAAELKAKFDEAGNILKDFINDSLIPQVVGEGATEARREASEAARQAAETARASAETGRESAEAQRETAESAREAAESARESAETARQAAEQEREAAQTAFFQGVSASAVMLDQGAQATAEAAPRNGSFHVAFGIPAGGPAGKSAYQYAVDGGYTGTEEEFQALMASGPWANAKRADFNFIYNVHQPASNLPPVNQDTTIENAWPVFATSVCMEQPLCLKNVKIRGVAPPEDTCDAVTKGYVDGTAAALEKKVNNLFVVNNFTVQGPVSAGTTLTQSVSHKISDYPDIKTLPCIYFGQVMDKHYSSSYSFEFRYIMKSMLVDSWYYSSDIVYKCVNEIPEGKTVYLTYICLNV